MSLYVKYIQHLMGAWWLTILVLLAWLSSHASSLLDMLSATHWQYFKFYVKFQPQIP